MFVLVSGLKKISMSHCTKQFTTQFSFKMIANGI